ncbi:Hsp20/alpha crystallin family protein [Neobacillus sp. MM2021_6]|uniref:Hsp20/alpha crystallin family protein n=1 Tax=Bacillaceae TaxID=186817 RepID=UPI001408F597|nr:MULTISPECIES: Hsp20/alpha crystallin family protein [Bacillaceae]MBO0958196.1 Hsp20/alpha crystallin family protein [Neobacillus sp. MM2021_6]NHC18532.1 Hsp20/alpha crystallin family protein [Bacillus sp. MM2020_4]WML40332.1 Hsp20/alpha crystallin family protein [Neobacillus sp. OS1-2]
MTSKLPSDKNNPKKPIPEPFRDLMKSMNDFFTEKPVRGFLQSIDDFFKTPFPVASGFPVETVETGKEYIITAELPGVKRDQIQLNITGNYITISIENNELETVENDQSQVYHRKFIRQHSTRTISLPHAINEKMVKASYRDGLLQIRIPQERGKIIEIEE